MATPPFPDDTFLGRWLGGTLDEAEKTALRERPEFADYERLLGAMEGMRPPEFDSAANYEKLKAARQQRGKSPAGRRRLHLYLRPALAVAATVALLLTVWYFLPVGEQAFTAERGQRIGNAALADGSTASLNAASTLTFSRNDDERIARMSGEVYFDVSKATDTFRVITELGQVTVVGTAFNVYSRADSLAVSCTEGRVRVAFTGIGTTALLTPGQSVYRVTGRAPQLGDTSPNATLDWREGRSVFVNRPLAEILAALERQFDLEIQRPAGLDLDKRYEVTFPNDNVEQALRNALDPIQNFTYARNGKRVQLLPSN